MVFTTWPFAFFMLFMFVVYWWVVPFKWRAAFLLAGSLGYFTYNYPPHAVLLLLLTVFVYGIGRIILSYRPIPVVAGTEAGALAEKAGVLRADASERRKWLLGFGLVVCAATLCYYKYTPLAAATWNSLSDRFGLDASTPIPRLIIPIGISFFTFEFIHYLTDLYFGKVKSTSFLDFSLFAFFFPSLISGPIKRFQIFQDQLETMGGFQASYVAEGLHRIVLGLAKKIVIADTANLLTTALNHPAESSRISLWIAMYAYAVKIYYDFSGYTDIAIGCAQLLGYRLPENFNRPYRQPNLSKFWNCWHMSLSSWIRDYLFIPLGGSRAGNLRTLFNLTIVMAICGLWHGANWNFLVWGLWHGAGLAALRIYGAATSKTKRAPDSRLVRWASTAVTIQFVCIGWVLFAAPDLPTALLALRRMV
jgi:alginate O-acetyltransferase complex protein AlgI